MNILKRFAVLAVIALSGLAGVVSPVTAATDSNCMSKMAAVLIEEVAGGGLEVKGSVTVTSCGGVWMTYADGTSIDVAEAFVSDTGLDFFKSDLDYVALMLQSYGTVPAEYRPNNKVFTLLPSRGSITPEHSDLALSTSGLADTIVFKFDEDSPIMLLKFYAIGGAWFGSQLHG